MIIDLLPALACGAVVLGGFCRRRPLPDRMAALVPSVTTARPLAAADPRLRRWAAAVAATAVAALVLPLVAPLAGVAAWGMPVLRARRRAREALDAQRRSVPEAVDLFVLAVGAGLTVPLAVAAVADRLRGPVAEQLSRACEEMGRGRRCADTLDDAARRLVPEARPLLAALSSSERYGAPLTDALVRLAADARADHRRRAEEAARRVPVKLLFPLVLCVLPAFVLLTLAPLLAGAFGSLRL